ncbi:NrsF family protein, partial [Caulobacter sp. HMWF009]
TLLGLWLVRGLAPTRPVLAGFATGAFAGGVAATVYGLHCPESTFVFVGLWYSLGIMACAGLGAVLGRIVLRW